MNDNKRSDIFYKEGKILLSSYMSSEPIFKWNFSYIFLSVVRNDKMVYDVMAMEDSFIEVLLKFLWISNELYPVPIFLSKFKIVFNN